MNKILSKKQSQNLQYNNTAISIVTADTPLLSNPQIKMGIIHLFNFWKGEWGVGGAIKYQFPLKFCQ
jgi:hypothetical protein